MEIHKPKPVHNWRELLTEIGVIVFGIVIAISLEQLVEAWHWAGEVKIAREALRAEIAPISTFYASRLTIAPCMDKKLDAVSDLIRDAAAGRPSPAEGIKFVGLGSVLSDSEWQSERSSQVLTHFPRSELAQMSSFYGQLPDVRQFIHDEANAWAALAVLSDGSQKLEAADLAQLRVNYHLARRYEYLITLIAARELGITKKLAVAYPSPGPELTTARCGVGAAIYKF
jgi:hypothetical protein